MTQPTLNPQDDGSWKVHDDWQAQVNGCLLTVPAGTRTDLASVPVFLRGLPGLGPSQLGGAAPAVVHDLIYSARGRVETLTEPATRFTRRAADRVFRQLMGRYGVGWRRWLAWAAVRVGGWIPWPPAASTWRNVASRSLHTAWQAGAALLIVRGMNWPSWVILVAAAGLSAFKTLVVVPVGERVAGTLYR